MSVMYVARNCCSSNWERIEKSLGEVAEMARRLGLAATGKELKVVHSPPARITSRIIQAATVKELKDDLLLGGHPSHLPAAATGKELKGSSCVSINPRRSTAATGKELKALDLERPLPQLDALPQQLGKN